MDESIKAKFICPNCGEVSQEDVAFLCNTCQSNEVEEVDGVFMCPICKIKSEPLMCRVCESKDVHMHGETVDLPGKDHPHK